MALKIQARGWKETVKLLSLPYDNLFQPIPDSPLSHDGLGTRFAQVRRHTLEHARLEKNGRQFNNRLVTKVYFVLRLAKISRSTCNSWILFTWPYNHSVRRLLCRAPGMHEGLKAGATWNSKDSQGK